MKTYSQNVAGAWPTDVTWAIREEVDDDETPIVRVYLRITGDCTDADGNVVKRFVIGMPHGDDALGNPEPLIMIQTTLPQRPTLNEIMVASAAAVPQAVAALKSDLAGYDYVLEPTTFEGLAHQVN